MRFIMSVIMALALAGCLRTSEPAFDETNSVAAGDAPELVHFVEVWERAMPEENSPRALIEDGNRVHVENGLVIVEERDSRPEGTAEYYALAVAGNRPLICLVHDEKMDVIAKRNAVELKIDRPSDMDEPTPAPMMATGEKAALHAFVLDAFRNGLLACTGPSALTGI